VHARLMRSVSSLDDAFSAVTRHLGQRTGAAIPQAAHI
jgi:hypothetical protein